MNKKYLLLIAILPTIASAQTKYTESKNGDVVTVVNAGGQKLGYSASSGVKILTVDGLSF
jgi:beta-glucosidase